MSWKCACARVCVCLRKCLYIYLWCCLVLVRVCLQVSLLCLCLCEGLLENPSFKVLWKIIFPGICTKSEECSQFWITRLTFCNWMITYIRTFLLGIRVLFVDVANCFYINKWKNFNLRIYCFPNVCHFHCQQETVCFVACFIISVSKMVL